MWMTLPYARGRDLDKSGILAQSFNVLCTAVAHSGSQTPHELINERAKWSFEGHAPFDPLRNQLVWPTIGSCLTIPLARAFNHRSERSHPSVNFERSTLIQNLLTRTFGHTG